MKKTLAVILAAMMLLAFAGCGSKNGPTVVVETPAPKAEITPVPAPETPEPEETPAPQEEAPAENPDFDEEMFNKAKALEGEDIRELYDAIGMPDSAEEYTSSCMGDGEDGQLHYPGFDVFTYREKGEEIVYIVEKN